METVLHLTDWAMKSTVFCVTIIGLQMGLGLVLVALVNRQEPRTK